VRKENSAGNPSLNNNIRELPDSIRVYMQIINVECQGSDDKLDCAERGGKDILGGSIGMVCVVGAKGKRPLSKTKSTISQRINEKRQG